MGGYQSFKFENSLISSIYPTSPLDYDNQNAPSSEAKARKDVMKTVSERGKYFYSYAEYLFAKTIAAVRGCCCCGEGKFVQRRLKKLQRHENAMGKLTKEVDVVKLVYINRIG